jgi:hypothetical protein
VTERAAENSIEEEFSAEWKKVLPAFSRHARKFSYRTQALCLVTLISLSASRDPGDAM